MTWVEISPSDLEKPREFFHVHPDGYHPATREDHHMGIGTQLRCLDCNEIAGGNDAWLFYREYPDAKLAEAFAVNFAQEHLSDLERIDYFDELEKNDS